MFWNKKEEDKLLPDLPPYRRSGFVVGNSGPGAEPFMQESEESEEVGGEMQELPSFPDSMANRGFSQSAIKDAVGNSNEYVGQSFPEEPQNQTVEMEEWSPSLSAPQAPEEQEYENYEQPTEKYVPQYPLPNPRYKPLPKQSYSEPMRSIGEPPAGFDMGRPRKNEDIFVKLDKFYLARKALLDAQQKMRDVDELLRRIRETKMREEQELDAWEREMMNIKARMNDVTINLFEKVD